MTNPRAPRQARVTDQDLRALISKVDHIIALLETEPPQPVDNDTRFYPGVGTIEPIGTNTGPSPIQQAAAAALDANTETR